MQIADVLSFHAYLIQIYLPTLVGYMLEEMVQAMSPFLEFCYLVQHPVINQSMLAAIDDAVQNFHAKHKIFIDTSVQDHFSLPCQHSMIHYSTLIKMFGTLNGLCSSITESQHIKAVKEPWQHPNHYEALGQMLVTNQWLNKLAAVHVDYTKRGMLQGPFLPVPAVVEEQPTSDSDDDYGAVEDLELQEATTFDVCLACRPGTFKFVLVPNIIQPTNFTSA